MKLVRANRIADRLAQRVEQVTGQQLDNPSVSWANTDIAATSGSNIGLSRSWLAGASGKEIRGVLAHELGHVLQGANSNLSGQQQEAYGDALRSRLGLGVGSGYTSTQEQQMERLSNQDFKALSGEAVSGYIDRSNLKENAMTGPAAPSPGHDGGRMRNTFANILSKNKVDYNNSGGGKALPSLDPASTANYYAQLSGLASQYQLGIAALKNQRVGIRAQAGQALAQVRSQKLVDLSSAENTAIERGATGGSADLQTRAGVRGAAAAGIETVQQQKLAALADTRIQQQGLGLQYFQGAQQLEADKLAQQQQLLAQQLQNNLIVSGQESQMDVYKAIYRAVTQGLNPGGNGNGNGGPSVPGLTPGNGYNNTGRVPSPGPIGPGTY